MASPGRLYRDFSKHKWDKIVADEEGKKNYPVIDCEVCVACRKQSETRYICKFCIVLLQLLDSLYVVSSVLGSGVSSVQSNIK
jgi:hypothetical protein